MPEQDAILHLISTELGKLKYSKNYLVNKIYVTATGLEPATIWLINEHSTI